MPTIHRERGFRFMVYPGDHGRPHVHVWKAGVEAKIAIGDIAHAPEAVDPGAMRTKEVRRAIRIVEREQERFFAAWEDFNA